MIFDLPSKNQTVNMQLVIVKISETKTLEGRLDHSTVRDKMHLPESGVFEIIEELVSVAVDHRAEAVEGRNRIDEDEIVPKIRAFAFGPQTLMDENHCSLIGAARLAELLL